MKKEKDMLCLFAVALGAVFLFNPTINIVDPLPDLVGFWLIAWGLTAVSYMSELLYESRKKFVYLAFLTAAKLAVCFALPGATGTFIVLMAFSFAVVETILFIPAASGLFEGITSLGMRHGAAAPFYAPLSKKRSKKVLKLENKIEAQQDPKKRKRLVARKEKVSRPMSVGALKVLTIVAFLVRAVGSVVPTLPSLMMYGDTLFLTEGQIVWADYVGVFYIIAWICGFAVGIPWLCAFRRYIKGIISETSFTGILYEKYKNEVLSDTGRLIAERMKKVMVLTVLAALATFQFPIDYVNSTPNLISAGLLVAALLYMMPYSKKRAVATVIISAFWAALSAVGVWLQIDYRANNYKPSAAVAFGGEGRGMADELYFRMEIFSYAEALMFLITAFLFASLFIKVLSSHINAMPARQDGLKRDAKKLKKCLVPVGISGGVVILFNFALTFVTKYLSGAWLINAIAVIVFFIFTLNAYYKLYENVYIPLKRKF